VRPRASTRPTLDALCYVFDISGNFTRPGIEVRASHSRSECVPSPLAECWDDPGRVVGTRWDVRLSRAGTWMLCRLIKVSNTIILRTYLDARYEMCHVIPSRRCLLSPISPNPAPIPAMVMHVRALMLSLSIIRTIFVRIVPPPRGPDPHSTCLPIAAPAA
jgi:hypothetical protein